MAAGVHILPIMKNELAKYYGSQAFTAGQARAPMADTAFARMAATLDAPELMPAAYAFTEGWDRAKQTATMAALNGVALAA